jgi:hypothetical protein
MSDISESGWARKAGADMSAVFENDQFPIENDQFPIQPADVGIRRLQAAFTSRLVQIPGAALIVIGAFFTTLWMTEPTPMNVASEPDRGSSGSEIDKLAGMQVSTWEGLRESAADAGLVPARSLVGVVDGLTRANEREVTVHGWLADPRGDGAPLNLIAFVGSKSVAFGKTASERPDVASALRLPDGAEKNVGFELTFSCKTGQVPIIVGVGSGRQYRILELTKAC